MNLKNAMLCIDCDEIFVVEGAPCNPRCPTCASSVFIPLSSWLGKVRALDSGTDEARLVARDEGAAKRRRMEIVHPTPIAA